MGRLIQCSPQTKDEYYPALPEMEEFLLMRAIPKE